MSELVGRKDANRIIPWRLIGWGGAVVLLALPFVAMQFAVTGVNWSAGDFIFAAALFAVIGGLFEFAVRTSSNGTYRLAFGLGLLGFFATIWVNLAVGIVGSEDNSANLMFFVALLVGIVASLSARFRPAGMARAMFITAAALAIAFVAAQLGHRDDPDVKPPIEAVGAGLFVLFFVGSAWLFRRAAAQSSSSS